MTEKIVIVGGGHAAAQLIATLGQLKFNGDIVLLGEERWLPYQRPPLSKKYLAGELETERLYVKPESFYKEHRVEMRLETTVTAIDREARTLQLDGGDLVSYDRLVLATGSRPRELDIDGMALRGVHYLRSLADVQAIREDFKPGRRVVIVGGGYIGLEVAAVTQALGLDVTVMEMADRVMSRVVSAEISDFYQIEHTERGVKLRLATNVTALRGRKRIKSVETSNGEELPADLVIVGVGVVPNTELAGDAGLDVDDGIVVDDRCQSSDPAIFAIGDCTRHPNETYGRMLRLESVHNAVEQAKTAAANLCGVETHYSEVPWFWSDQYDLKLQIAGLSDGYDDVVIRGNPADRSFSCVYLRERRLIAVDAVNAPRDFVQSKKLIAAGALIDMEKLVNSEIELKELSLSG
ncbi:MAG: FAD-dependent oxidoreductase [Gammaproteobacteria bacterium]|nr:FAD-dependent oxidoreductase [Gammaproteobacteria bacterium]